MGSNKKLVWIKKKNIKSFGYATQYNLKFGTFTSLLSLVIAYCYSVIFFALILKQSQLLCLQPLIQNKKKINISKSSTRLLRQLDNSSLQKKKKKHQGNT